MSKSYRRNDGFGGSKGRSGRNGQWSKSPHHHQGHGWGRRGYDDDCRGGGGWNSWKNQGGGHNNDDYEDDSEEW